MNQILQHLNDPEYMHVMLNPIPVYGLGMGVVAMIAALIYRRRPIIIAALVLIFLSSLAAWPTYHYGEAAYDRVKSMSDTAGDQWLDQHMARAEKLIYAFYVLAAVAVAAIFVPLKWPRTSQPLAIAALGLALATLGIGSWISYPAGHVRHKEFRFEPPPPKPEGMHEHGAMDYDAMHGEHTEGEQAKPMDHGSMPGMEADKSGDSKEQPMQHDAAPQPAAPTQEQLEASRLQLEASRMQLEASRLQLEASRKQLEAADAAKANMASPSPQQTQSPHTEDGHELEP